LKALQDTSILGATRYDALLVVSFGGPDGPDAVRPFLANVLRGKRVSEDRVREIAAHYDIVGGVSPINAQNRALVEALRREFQAHRLSLPIYLGNRNWRPLLEDTIRRMADDGVTRAAAFVTSAYSSYSGCRQYREDILRAQEQVGTRAPVIDKLRVFFNHPGFIGANVAHLRQSLLQLPESRRGSAHVVFTAHSIPCSMARSSAYQAQLDEASRLVAAGAGVKDYSLAFQSRSGPPQVPWLEPDILDHIGLQIADCRLQNEGVHDLLIMPIGFVSDHMEVVYDLDIEAVERARKAGFNVIRVPTVGTHPAYVSMIRDLILERMTPNAVRPALGKMGPVPDICPAMCCQSGYVDDA